MTRRRAPLRKVTKTVAASHCSRMTKNTATLTFSTDLTLECGHIVRVSGCGIPVHPPERYGMQRCKDCYREESK